MMLCLGLFLAAVAGTNWLANPYGAWRISVVDRVFLKDVVEATRVITPYRLWTEEPTTPLAGTSRMVVGVPIEQGQRGRVLNAGLMRASLDEMAATVAVAMRNSSLKHLIWGVDFFSFDEAEAGFHDLQMLRRLKGGTSGFSSWRPC
jgi:hypothetical protein